jgi:hypothetical protein
MNNPVLSYVYAVIVDSIILRNNVHKLWNNVCAAGSRYLSSTRDLCVKPKFIV